MYELDSHEDTKGTLPKQKMFTSASEMSDKIL